MDVNKLRVLREVGYSIGFHCETCVHSDLSPDGWGYCNLHTYVHGKHNAGVSRLSVHRLGACGQYDRDAVKHAGLGLGAFDEFSG